MGTGRLLIICGARRTGTTLLAAMLSADGSTPPFPGEAQLLPQWLSSYRWALQDFPIRGLPFFRDEQELRRFYRRFLGAFVVHCREKFGPDASLVLKSPELSLVFAEARELFPEALFFVTVRDPRDQVASEWRVIGRRRGGLRDRRILWTRNFQALARAYVRYYEPILDELERRRDGIHVQPFEQLVTAPHEAMQRLEAFSGLRLDGFDPTAEWPRIADTFWGAGETPSDTRFYGKAVESGRVGSWTESMSARAGHRVERTCAPVTRRLQPFLR